MACNDCIMHQISSSELVKQLGGKPGEFPIAGSIELTLRCNVRCRHCYILYPGATQGEMTTDEVKAVLDKLADLGVLFLLMTGGEPLARSDFKELYLYARNKGFLITLFTNATLIDDEMADFFAAHPPRRVEVTIYGHTEETYENVTGVRGSYKRFRRGIELILKHKLALALKTVAMRTNRHEFEQIKAWAEGMGVPFRFDAMINPQLDGGTEVLKERIDPEDYVRLEGLTDHHRDHYQKLLDMAQKKPRSRKAFSCGAGIKTFHVDPRGNIHPCMMWRNNPYSLKTGDLDGWHQHLGALRQTEIPADSECGSCAHHLACNNCAATSALENGGVPGRPVGYYCQINYTREKLLKLHRFEIDSGSTPNPKEEMVHND